ncbi:hypothetical protein ACFL27_04170 [candidate division CSSED10-310 bacterium]|uniref:ABC transporter permease n=1 Tax=candidate division CSSED10-310 bacterium TaxID=2855610 RepID=A0ABV6YT64_UNCC1
MIGFYYELIYRTFRGMVLQQRKLLRQFKYLLGTSLGFLVIFGGIFFIVAGDKSKAQAVLLSLLSGEILNGIFLILSLMVALLVTFMWLFARTQMPIQLSEAELNLLLSGPLSRRSIIYFELLKNQKEIFLGGFVLWIIVFSFFEELHLSLFLAYVLFFNLGELHLRCCKLWKLRLRRFPVRKQQLWKYIIIILLVCYWCILFFGIESILSSVKTNILNQESSLMEAPRIVMGELSLAVQKHWLVFMLAPFLVVLAPFFHSPIMPEGIRWVLPLFLLLVHVEWFVRSLVQYGDLTPAQIFETPLKQDQLSGLRKLVGTGRKRIPFQLIPVGAPEISIYWKNFLAFFRMPLTALILIAILIPLCLFLLSTALGAPRGLLAIESTLSFMVILMAPFMIMGWYDVELAKDFQNFELVRPWPLPGEKIFLAKAYAIATLAAIIALLCVGVYFSAYLSFKVVSISQTFTKIELYRMEKLPFLTLKDTTSLLIGLSGLIFPFAGMAALLYLMQTVIKLLLPGWVPKDLKSDDISSVGKSVINMLLLYAALLIGVLPSALMIGIVLLLQYIIGLPFVLWELAIFGMISFGVFWIEVHLLTKFVGGLWDNLDPSQEFLSR